MEVPDELYEVPLGVAKQVQSGDDLTIIAIGRMVDVAKEVANHLSYGIEIMDPVTLSPLDIDSLAASAKKTGRVLILSEATQQSGISAEIFAQLIEAGFDGKISRLGAKFMPISAAKSVELGQIPTQADIMQAIDTLLS